MKEITDWLVAGDGRRWPLLEKVTIGHDEDSDVLVSNGAPTESQARAILTRTSDGWELATDEPGRDYPFRSAVGMPRRPVGIGESFVIGGVRFTLERAEAQPMPNAERQLELHGRALSPEDPPPSRTCIPVGTGGRGRSLPFQMVWEGGSRYVLHSRRNGELWCRGQWVHGTTRIEPGDFFGTSDEAMRFVDRRSTVSFPSGFDSRLFWTSPGAVHVLTDHLLELGDPQAERMLQGQPGSPDEEAGWSDQLGHLHAEKALTIHWEHGFARVVRVTQSPRRTLTVLNRLQPLIRRDWAPGRMLEEFSVELGEHSEAGVRKLFETYTLPATLKIFRMPGRSFAEKARMQARLRALRLEVEVL